MCSLQNHKELVREKIEVGRWTHKKVSEFLKTSFPGEKGFSIRSIQRFCADADIHKTSRVAEDDLDEAVKSCIEMVKINIILTAIRV